MMHRPYRIERVLPMFLLLSAAVFWPWLKDYVNNPDSFQYLQIARHYSNGYWQEAVNGYWSPLISWLLALLLWTGIPSVLLFKGLQVFLALLTLKSWMRLTDRFIGEQRIAFWLKAAAIPLLLSEALLCLTPDLLFVSVMFFLLEHFVKGPVWHHRRRSLVAGVLGAILYFTKAFGLPFFLVFLLGSVVYHKRSGNTVAAGFVLQALGVFILLSGMWIALLSSKYDHFTVSEAAGFNTTREVSPLPGQTVLLPILYTEGLHAPAGKHALSAWEEPLQAVSLTPLDLYVNASRFALLTERNLLSIWYLDFRRQPGIIFLVMLFLFLWFGRRSDLVSPMTFYPLFTLVAVYAGYALILFHSRYSWICTWSMLLLSGFIVSRLEGSMPSTLRKIPILLFGLLLLLAVKRPVKELLYTQDKEVTAGGFVVDLLRLKNTMDQTYFDDRLTAASAKSISGLDGPFASRFSLNSERNRYFSSLMIAEYSRQRYFGQINDTVAGAPDTLRGHGVDYFAVWDDTLSRWQGRTPVFTYGRLRIFPTR